MAPVDEDFGIDFMTKTKPKTRKAEKTAARIVSKLHKLGFTRVSKVEDADSPIWVNVTKADSATGRKKNASECALARACVREKHADGAVINIGTSYIIKGNTAVRYKTSGGVGREITSFDRGAGFEAGNDYLLSAVPPMSRLDRVRPQRPSGPHEDNKPTPRPNVHRHHTANIRVSRVLPKKR